MTPCVARAGHRHVQETKPRDQIDFGVLDGKSRKLFWRREMSTVTRRSPTLVSRRERLY
jgi:hypothetical protein